LNDEKKFGCLNIMSVKVWLFEYYVSKSLIV